MTINRGRRQFLHALGSAAAWPLAAPARADDRWPSRPVTVVCPFAAGTSTDTLLRLVTASLSDGFGQNFIVENRPGANGNIAAGAVARSAPDGYTLLIATVGPIVNNKFMYKNLDFDPDRAFAPIVPLAYSPMIIIGSPKLPVTNLREVIAYAQNQSRSAQCRDCRGGIASAHLHRTPQQARRHLHRARGLSHYLAVVARPGVWRSSAFGPVCSDFRAAGAVGNAERSRNRHARAFARMADVPAAGESGLPGLEANGWSALFAPAGTPR